MKRFLHDDDFLVIGNLETRMSTQEVSSASLTSRMNAAESGLTSHNTRITTLENKFGSGKHPALAAVTVSPSGGVISLLGVEVATGAAITNLVASFNTLKVAHNDLVAACKTWGWMAS